LIRTKRIEMDKLINHGGILWRIKKEVSKETFIINEEINYEFVKSFKEYLNCDHVLQNQNNFLFVEEISELEFEEINES